MRLLVNLRQSVDHAACRAAFLAAGYTIEECGSGGTCHVFIVDGPATLPQSLQGDVHSMVDADAQVELDGLQVTSADPGLWHLDWIDGAVDGEYAYSGDGAGVPLCLIDTPVNDTSLVANFTQVHAPFSPGSVTHGTDTLRVAAALYDGVAKGAEIFHAQGFSGEGVGTVADVNAAWTAINDAMEADGRPFVLNTSFSFGSDSFAANVARTQSLGGFIFASAGNSNPNGLDFSTLTRFPSQNAGVFVVGAHDEQGVISFFSNFGPGVDVYAPGEGLTVGAGTSFSSPIVAGVAAILLGEGEVDPLVWIVANARDVNGLPTLQKFVWNAPTQTIELKGIKATVKPDGTVLMEVVYPPQGAVAAPPPPPPPPPPPDPDPGPDPSFSPDSLNLTWWLDGSDASVWFIDEARTTAASPNDLSSGVTIKGSHSGNHLIRHSSSLAPVWNGNAVVLGETGVLRSLNPTSANLRQPPHTFAFAVESTPTAGTDHLFDANGSNRQTLMRSGSNFQWHSNGGGTRTIAPADDIPHAWIVHINGASSYVEIDGVRVFEGDLGSSAFGGWMVGSWSGGTARWNGRLWQMMHTNDVLTSQQLIDLNAWLTARIV